MGHFETVKTYIQELQLTVTHEDPAEELVVVEDEQAGIKGLIIDCEDPILILEQPIFDLSPAAQKDPGILLRLLQMNRSLVHGSFTVDEAGKKVIFRDTLQLESLDLNELEGSIIALALGLAENSDEIIRFANT